MTITTEAPPTGASMLTENLHDESWGEPAWPERFTMLESHQWDALAEIMEHYANGVDVILLEAPTGSGKTVLAEALRRALGAEQTLYVANTKGLQDQFMRDFSDYARTLKGRANYPTHDYPNLFSDKWNPITCADCTYTRAELPACNSCDHDSPIDPSTNEAVRLPHCDWCHTTSKCPYRIAKNIALEAPVVVTNTAYFIGEANSGPRAGLTDMPFIVVDEADTLEDILVGQIEVYIPERRRKMYHIDMPAKKTVETAWLPWVEDEAIPKVKAAFKAISPRTSNIKARRERQYLERMLDKLELLRVLLAEGNAVYDGYKDGDIRFRPTKVNLNAPDMVWRHGDKWLLMSATFVDVAQTVEDLGIEQAGLSWATVYVPSTFPAENRPIHVKPVANMVFKEKAEEWPKMAAGIEEILTRYHPHDRTLIHTVSYDFSKFLTERLAHLDRPVLTYTESAQREKVLAEYSRTPGAVLLASSMDRGVDLPEDLCRAVIVAKVPFPNTSDKRVEKRLYAPGGGGRVWYAVQTVRSLVQMTGRGVRSKSDRCDIWVLDKQFNANVWKNSKALLPKWWADSIDWSGGAMIDLDNKSRAVLP